MTNNIVAHGALRERHQRQRAALAVVVGAQDEQHVLDRHDDDQRPEDERHDAEDHLARERRLQPQRRRATPSRHRAGSCRCRRRRRRACRASASRTPRRARQTVAPVPCFGGQGLGLGCDGHHGRPGERPSRSAHQAADWSKLRSSRLAPSKGGDVARSLSLDLPQLRFHKRAEDRQGEAARAESRRRRPASSTRARGHKSSSSRRGHPGRAGERPCRAIPSRSATALTRSKPPLRSGARRDRSGSGWLGAEDTHSTGHLRRGPLSAQVRSQSSDRRAHR